MFDKFKSPYPHQLNYRTANEQQIGQKQGDEERSPSPGRGKGTL